MPRQTIAARVAANLDQLRTLDRASLRVWALENGLDSAAGFSRFKKALVEHGIDYATLGRPVLVPTAELTLYSDAKVSRDRFAVVFGEDEPAWYGRFFGEVDEQSRGEMEAAKKAVWLASKVSAVAGRVLRLRLYVDAQWLIYANGETGGGKAGELRDYARRLGVALRVEWVRGTENPADAYTVCTGFQKWQESLYDAVNRVEILTTDVA
jgi:hypothetical protein